MRGLISLFISSMMLSFSLHAGSSTKNSTTPEKKSWNWRRIPIRLKNREWKILLTLRPREKDSEDLSIIPGHIPPQVHPKREFKPRINPHETLI